MGLTHAPVREGIMPRTRNTAPVRRLSLQLLLLAAVLLTLPAALAAQEEPENAPPPMDTTGCRRCLSGHRFVVSSLVADPFVTTHFRSGLGGGFASGLSAPFRNLDGEVIDSVGGDIGFVTLDLEYQYAAWRWLGLRVGASVLARVGTSAQSLLASGASVLAGTSFGLTGRVWRGASGEVTGAAQNALLSKTRQKRWTGGVRAAWTPAPWLGFTGVFEAGTADDP